tara:strand:+ start:712 stop:1176 length:465 start_codon:yes stop_codon:yes gene_type:complete
MAIEERGRKGPDGGKVIPGKEGSQGYTGSYAAQTLGTAAGALAAGSVALGPFGIALVGLGASFLGSAIDWLIGKKTEKKPTPPKIIPPKPQRKDLAGSVKSAPMKSGVFDYASLDPGRQQLAPNPIRQAAATRILSSPTFTQKNKTTPAFRGRV